MLRPVILWLRWVLAGVLALALAFLFAQPAPKSVTSEIPPGRIRVRFWHMWTAEWKDVVDTIAGEFNKSQDKYWVDALSVPAAGADSKFLLAVVGGDPPDVMAQWNPVIPTWADNNLLTPLETLMSPAEKERFDREAYPIVKRFGMYKGKLYGLTIGLNIFSCYYNPAHLREVGYDPEKFPETLEELMELGRKLEKFDKDGNMVRAGFIAPGITTMAPVFGGGFYDWEKGKLLINTPENLRALEFIAAERKRLGYDNVVRFQSGLDTGSFKGGWPFVGGAYSITVDGAWKVEEVRKNIKGFNYRTAALPPPKGGKALAGNTSGNFMIIPKSAKEKEGAWEFVKFWSGLDKPERAAQFYIWGGWLPLSPAIANSPLYQAYLKENPQFKTMVDLMPSKNLHPVPPVPYQVLFMDRLGRAQDAALRGTLTPKQALEQLEAEIEKELARRKEFGYEE